MAAGRARQSSRPHGGNRTTASAAAGLTSEAETLLRNVSLPLVLLCNSANRGGPPSRAFAHGYAAPRAAAYMFTHPRSRDADACGAARAAP